MAVHTIKRKLAFAACDIFGGGSFNIINFLYPGFLAMTMGLSPYWIGFVMLTARAWDAVSDPLMGQISDRTSSRFGKRRVYLVIMSPMVLISFLLLFFPFSLPSTALRVLTVLGAYLLFYTVQTMIMIPYYSLSSEISNDYQVRASYNSWRLGFSIFSSILCVAVPGLLVDAFPENRGYIVMGLIFGAVFAVAVLITGLFAREEIITPPIKTKANIIKQFMKFLELKPFRHYFGMLLSVQSCMTVMSGLYFFLVDFYLCRTMTLAGEANLLRLISAALMFSMQIVALPVYLKLIEKKGKPFAFRAGALLWIVSALALFLLPADTAAWPVYLLASLLGLGISGPGLVPHTMFGDVADYAQLHFGVRTDGQMSGCVNFANKLIQAVVIAVVMAVLGLCGFVEQQVGAPAIVSQPESAQLALRLFMALSPLVIMGLGMRVSRGYTIDREAQREIAAELAAK